MKKLFFIYLIMNIVFCIFAIDIKPHIEYRGVLYDSKGTKVTDTVELVFSLYDTEDAAFTEYIWQEPHSEVQVENGEFRVLLGSQGSALNTSDFDKQLWLGIEYNGAQIEPRYELSVSPYAIQAQQALDVAGRQIHPEAVYTGEVMTYSLSAVAIDTDSLTVKGMDVLGDDRQLMVNGISVNDREIVTSDVINDTIAINNVDSLTAADVNAVSIDATSVNATGTITGNTVNAATVSSTNVNATSVTASGAIAGSNITAAGTLTGDTVNAGSISADSLDVSGNVGIGTTEPATSLHVNGKLTTESIHVKSNSFTVGGDLDKFYAVVFYDNGWSDGPAQFEITRSNIHADELNRGSMNLKIDWHANSWGHGSHYLNYENRYFKQPFVGKILEYTYRPYLIVWLRGNTTYYYRSLNNRVTLTQILGTDNSTCEFDPINNPDYDTAVNATYRTEADGVLPQTKIIDQNLSVKGNIGIGTNSPEAALEIKANTQIAPAGWFEAIRFTKEAHSAITHPSTGLLFGMNKEASGRAGAFYFGDIYGGEVLNKYVMKIDAHTGNVGIGTTSPDQRLAVNGKVKAKEFITDPTNWADFVFEDDYKLKSLTEVASYIENNGHLPDIPSAEDVQANGVGLSEMNIKLLQKIEELTLYMIELEKRNNELNQRLKALEETR